MRITNQNLKEIESTLTQKEFKIDQFLFTSLTNELKLTFKEEAFYFNIKMAAFNKFNIEYSMPHDLIGFASNDREWTAVVALFSSWLDGIKKEMIASDNVFRTLNREMDIVSTMKIYSHRFIKIYEQTLNAEQSELDEIIGMGYRKSLEILIKDYIIKKQKIKSKQKIYEMGISSCIENYIKDVRIQILAKRTNWLGNDHAHYYKVWKGKNVEDLKKLLHQIIKWIIMKDELDDMEKNVKKIQNTMVDPKNSSSKTKAHSSPKEEINSSIT